MSGPRPVGPQDIGASLALSAEAFGDMPAGFTPPSPDAWPLPGRHSWGTWDGDRLVARVMGREYHSWWHGREVPTCGVAGVAVAAESRGAGLLDALMATVLDEGLRERGEVLSTLYPTAPGIYRRYGYEVVSGLLEVEIATDRLGRVPRDPAVTLRRATPADVDDVRRVHATWAATHNGPLTRTGPSFPAAADELLSPYTAVTLAVLDRDQDGFAAGEVVGFASWHRGTGYDESSTIEVDDLVSLHAGATRSLWAMLGSHASVTGRVRLSTSGEDPVRLALPFAEWRVTKQVPYMLRVHDVAGALSGLLLGPLDARVPFSVRGDLLGTADGSWVLTTADGVSRCRPDDTSDGGPVLSPRGLALLFSGAQGCAAIRAAGLMGGDDASDRVLDALFGGRRVHVRDYF
jgi:predicted acetyltransferase